jgi:hypothetical protein
LTDAKGGSLLKVTSIIAFCFGVPDPWNSSKKEIAMSRWIRGPLVQALTGSVLAIFILLVLGGIVVSCGSERWSVKTGSDPDSWMVDLSNPYYTTVTEMGSFDRPGYLPPNNRVDPYETMSYYTNAYLIQYKRESDQDYHLVLMDDNGSTMVAEIPYPNCVSNASPWKDWITSARAEMDSMFYVTTSFQYTFTPCAVFGVGFFDFDHGQTGKAPNIFELHPVLDIAF